MEVKQYCLGFRMPVIFFFFLLNYQINDEDKNFILSWQYVPILSMKKKKVSGRGYHITFKNKILLQSLLLFLNPQKS